MSSILWKNFHICFSKLKCLPPIQPSDNHHPPPPTEDYSTAIVLTKNFNSLYDVTTTSSDQTLLSSSISSDDSSDNSSSSSSAAAALPDLASAYASSRFFFSSPGRSNSIIDSPPPSEPPPAAVTGMGGFTVQKYSSDPYGDFRRSMLEMMAAKDMMKDESINDNNNNNWEYLHELLLCYLALNPKHTHKFIIGAFSDIVVLLMSRPSLRPPPATSGKSKKLGGRRQRSANHSPRPTLV